jgi:hypothetical protein
MDCTKNGIEIPTWIASISETKVKQSFQFHVITKRTGVSDVSAQFSRDESAFGCSRMKTVVRDVQVEIHSLLVNTQIEDATRRIAVTFEDVKI